MEAIDLLPLLHQQGISIVGKKDGYHRPSFSLNVATKEFIELFEVVKNTFNPTIIAGFCFSILPYITKNGPKFSEEEATELWAKFGDFLQNVDLEYPSIYGFLEGLTALSATKSKHIDPFLKIISKPLEKNEKIVPKILVSIYQYIEPSFFSENAEHLLGLISDYLKDGEDDYSKVILLMIINITNVDIEKIKILDELTSNMWAMIYDVSERSKHLMMQIFKALTSMRHEKYQLFELENKVLKKRFIESTNTATNASEVLDALSEPLRYAAFLNSNDLEFITSATISYQGIFIGQNGFVHKRSLKSLSESAGLLMHSQLHIMMHVISDEIETANYPAALALWGKLEFFFEDHDKECLQKLTEKIKLGFTTNYPIRSPLLYALKNISEQVSADEKLVEELLPFIINSVPSQDAEEAHNALKCLINLIRYQSIQARDAVNKVIVLSTSVSFNAISTFFQYLVECAEAFQNDEANEVVIIANLLLDAGCCESTHPLVRSKALRYFFDLHDIYPNVIKDSVKDTILSIVDILTKFPTKDAAKSAESFLDYDTEHKVYPILSKLAQNEGIEDRKSYALVCARISSEHPEYKYPDGVIESLYKSEDFVIKRRAVKCLAITRKVYNRDLIHEIFPDIVSIAKETKDKSFVDNTFKIMKTYIEGYSKPPQPAHELIYSTLQGRIALFNNVPPYVFSSTSFAFFTALKTFIKQFPSHGHQIAEILTSWIPSISNAMLPSLCKPIKEALLQNVFNEGEADNIYGVLLEKVTEECNYMPPICEAIDLAALLRKKFPHLSLMALLATLEEVWDKYSKEENVITFIGPLFLDLIIQNVADLTEKSDITKQIAKAIVQKHYTFDAPTMADLFCRLYDSNPSFCNPNGDCALVFTFYLSHTKSEQEEYGLSDIILDEMFQRLRTILRSDKELAPQLLNFFDRKHPENMDRYKKLTTLKVRPVF